MNHPNDLCEPFAKILGGKGTFNNGVCSVSLKRSFQVTVQGRPSATVAPAGVLFEALDRNGNALNLAEIAILQEEVPAFASAVVRQGMTVSALHNHWLYTEPVIMYIHVQSVEPPLHFARKMAEAFRTLSSYPVPDAH